MRLIQLETDLGIQAGDTQTKMTASWLSTGSPGGDRVLRQAVLAFQYRFRPPGGPQQVGLTLPDQYLSRGRVAEES